MSDEVIDLSDPDVVKFLEALEEKAERDDEDADG